ncbi:Non-specific lipid-transfer protein-like 2 [Halotydeus destructor]|nr:Non-specific lipid-transfer protein-like 2 [Halotydeus destructor]
MGRKVYVIGVGMTKFVKPGANKVLDYPQMGTEAVTRALADAKVEYSQIEHASCGFVYGDSTCGQKILYEVGMTGIPIVNVNNNCATGSSALYLSKRLIEGGLAECALALGFEKMSRGSLTSKFSDRVNPMQCHLDLFDEMFGMKQAPVTAQLFGMAGKEHMEKYGSKPEHFAKIAWKNHKHSVNNPNAQFREEYTVEDCMSGTPVFEFMTKYQCCPTSDGAAAAVLASEEFVVKHNLQDQAIEIMAMEMTTDAPSVFKERSAIKLIGFDMVKNCAEKAYKMAGIKPTDVQVIELHDCFSANELITYEALGLCPVGKAGDFIDSGNNTYGGKYVINPSGGLLSKGHPLGATGIAQCAELSWQLRGQADLRQVPNAKIGLQENIGLGGAVVVAIYRKANIGATQAKL